MGSVRRSVIAAVAALAGCATYENFAAKMNMYVGVPEAAFIGRFGPPDSSYQLADGSRVLSFTKGQTINLPGYTTMTPVTTNTYGNVSTYQGMRQPMYGNYSATSTTMVPTTTPGTTIQYWCRVLLTVKPDGIIKSWTSEGNNCTSDSQR